MKRLLADLLFTIVLTLLIIAMKLDKSATKRNIKKFILELESEI